MTSVAVYTAAALAEIGLLGNRPHRCTNSGRR
jgi:hypothetical protein